METQLNLEAHQAIKNLTQVGIDEEQATVLVSTFGNFSNNIATKDDLEVVKQGLTQEMNAMDDRQSQRSDYLEKTLTQQMSDMEARLTQRMDAMDDKQSQRSDHLEKTLTQQMSAMEAKQAQEMKAMDTKQSQRSDHLEKSLTQQMSAMEAKQAQEMKAMDTKQSQRSDHLEKTLIREISKSRYVMFAAGAGGALIMLGLYEALGRFLN